MYFELVGEIGDVETIAVGRGIRDLARLRKRCGTGLPGCVGDRRHVTGRPLGVVVLRSKSNRLADLVPLVVTRRGVDASGALCGIRRVPR